MKQILLLFAAVPFLGNAVPPSSPDAFNITVLVGPAPGSTSSETVRMVCRQGCAWKEASTSWGTALVDASGVQRAPERLDVRHVDRYALVVRPTDTGAELTCHVGCAWTHLSFDGSQADIDEHGVSHIRR